MRIPLLPMATLSDGNRSRKSKNVSRGRTLQSDPKNQVDLQPLFFPRSEPLSGLSTVTASFGTISRTCM